jgi:hypothetical protein
MVDSLDLMVKEGMLIEEDESNNCEAIVIPD